MTTLENSQQSDLFGMESESMSSQGASRVRTSAQQATRQALQKAPGAASGQSVPVYLGSFDQDSNTPSLRTSQHSLVETMGGGLSRFCGTYPRSGMMRSGTVYQLPNLARTITEIGSGLLPTPAASDPRTQFFKTNTDGNFSRGLALGQVLIGESGELNPVFVEMLMMYPTGHTELNPSETP